MYRVSPDCFFDFVFLIQCFLDLGGVSDSMRPCRIDIPASPMPAGGQFVCCDWLVYQPELDLKYNKIQSSDGPRVEGQGCGQRKKGCGPRGVDRAGLGAGHQPFPLSIARPEVLRWSSFENGSWLERVMASICVCIVYRVMPSVPRLCKGDVSRSALRGRTGAPRDVCATATDGAVVCEGRWPCSSKHSHVRQRVASCVG